ncbi:hypothetical protein [Kordiimonas sp.]|uniref:hypothetical protein n=1 Tax=Kordiimonas sp. TaxID=1970157 RepID=UPI003A95C6AB
MDLLFKRSQEGGIGRASFKLFCKLDLDDQEQALTKKYRFDEAVLIYTYQPTLARKAFLRSLGVFILLWLLSLAMFGARAIFANALFAFLLIMVVTAVFGFWYYHQNRETIFVRDLIHGRYFKCDSVIELARKEAWLETVCSYLRQVMESALHWDGEERFPIKALPKDEAKKIIIKGL